MAKRSKAGSGKRATARKAKKSSTARKVVKAVAKQTPVKVDASERHCPKGAVRVGDAPSGRTIEITITLRGPKLPDINTPGIASRNLVKSFGASKSDADKVSRVLRQFGLSIDAVSLGTRSMQVSGTVAQMEDAFRPNLGIYKKAGEPEFRDREGKYAVPPSLTKIITSVLGFGERRIAQRRPARARTAKSRRLHAFAPSDIEDHYRFPPGHGAGERIAIAEFGGGYFAEDLAKYCKKFGRAVPKVTTIGVGTPVRNLAQINRLKKGRQGVINDTGEVMMDVQVVAGLCPEAEISVYFARDTQKGWVDMLHRRHRCASR